MLIQGNRDLFVEFFEVQFAIFISGSNAIRFKADFKQACLVCHIMALPLTKKNCKLYLRFSICAVGTMVLKRLDIVYGGVLRWKVPLPKVWVYTFKVDGEN